MFEDWYSSYPKKVARADAEKAWRAMSEKQRSEAMSALPAHCAKWLHDGTEKQYIPYPATWLRGKRWEDEIEITPQATSNWRQSEEGTLAMAAKVGIAPHAGEDYQSLRNRISAKLVRAA